MTEKEQTDLRAYCAFILKEYGFDIPVNDPVVPALFIIHKETERNAARNNELVSEIKHASARISPRVFNFHTAEAAFKFQLGKAVIWVSSALVVVVTAAIAIWYYSITAAVVQAQNAIKTAGRMAELGKRVEKDLKGYYFVDFKAADGDSIRFLTEYVRINARTVRVYISK